MSRDGGSCGSQLYSCYNRENASEIPSLAKLTVIPSGEPDIDINNTLTNETYIDDEDTDLILNKVINGDNITYHDTLTNQSS